jgi:uncharacterized protein (DUF2141 family)
MRMKKSLFLLAVFAVVLTGAETPPAQARLVVELGNFRHRRGDAKLLLFSGKEGFPDTPARALRQVIEPIAGDRVRFTITNLKPGTYAISCFHDENGNGTLDMGTFGPKEGYGFSNNVTGTFGPPSFRAASFTVTAPETQIRIRLRY